MSKLIYYQKLCEQLFERKNKYRMKIKEKFKEINGCSNRSDLEDGIDFLIADVSEILVRRHLEVSINDFLTECFNEIDRMNERRKKILSFEEDKVNVYYNKVKINLLYSNNRCQRILLIPESITLDVLAEIILDLFNCDRSHCYSFTLNREELEYSDYEVDLTSIFYDPYICENRYLFEITPKDKLVLTYDYGDNWQFDVKVLKGKTLSDLPHRPIILSGKGRGIIEDNKHDFIRIAYYDYDLDEIEENDESEYDEDKNQGFYCNVRRVSESFDDFDIEKYQNKINKYKV